MESPPSDLDRALLERFAQWEADGLRRRLPEGDAGFPLLDFASNDYLGLAAEPWLGEVFARAASQHGSGAGASRLLAHAGSPHRALEEALAAWKNTEAALCFSSGYSTALGTLSALLTREDTVILDKLCHASLIDGARLSGAHIRVFPHNHLERLEAVLQQSRRKNPQGLLLVITEGVFSMDGDTAPLREIVALKNRYGAVLMVDEAHSVGVWGEQGRGWAAELGVAAEIEIQMGTLSKAFGCAGGYVCGSRLLVDWLVNRARSFVYSTAPPPAVAVAAQAALEWMQSDAGRVRRAELHERMAVFNALLKRPLPAQSSIFPIPARGVGTALEWSNQLRAAGFRIPPIRYPTVARGKERLRVTVTAKHSVDQIQGLHSALGRLQGMDEAESGAARQGPGEFCIKRAGP